MKASLVSEKSERIIMFQWIIFWNGLFPDVNEVIRSFYSIIRSPVLLLYYVPAYVIVNRNF